MKMTTQQYQQMVAAKVTQQLQKLAENEANRIVANLTKRVGTPDVSAPVREPRKRRDRKASRRQYAPKGSWLALGKPDPKAPAPTGQMAKAYDIAQMALANGPAERGVLTQVLVDANEGWTRVTASGCVSRLVANGRMVVVATPRNH